MVLSDKEIYKLYNEGELDFAVKDKNMRFDLYDQVQPASIDLRLDSTIIRFKKEVNEFDIRNLENVKDSIETVKVNKGEPIRLESNELIFCQTFEELKMPKDCMGIIEGKSRFARLGLAVHSTGGFINPEFRGVMPLQIINNNKIPIVIYPFISVCQLILIRTESTPLIPYPNRTNNPYYKELIAGPSVLHKDQAFDFDEIDYMKLGEEKRKIDNYIRGLASFNYESFQVQNVNNNNTKKEGMEKTKVEINFNGGTPSIGNINLGKVMGNVTSNLQELNTKGQIELSQAIKGLSEAIVNNSFISDDNKIEYIENLKFLSDEAIKPIEKRNNSVVKTVLTTLGKGLEVVSNMASVWGTFGPQLMTFFHSF